MEDINIFYDYSEDSFVINSFEDSYNIFSKDDLFQKVIEEEDSFKISNNIKIENLKTKPSLNENLQTPKNLKENLENKEKNELSQTPKNEVEKTENLPKKIALGRKRKNSNEKGIHNKYSEDNIIRKIKSNLLNILYNFINMFIYEIYEGNIGKGIFKKQLLKMNQRQIIDSKNNKVFLNKKLKHIFSDNICEKYTYFPLEFNKNLIEELLNELDGEKRKKLKNLFDLTFLDCLLHFRGDKKIEILQGLESLEDLCQKFKEDKEYLESFRYSVFQFENIILRKKNRMQKK